MKSFLNRFKRKEDEESPESKPVSSAESRTDVPLKRTGISVTPEEALAESEAAKEARALEAGPPPDENLVLELGDFLHRIPPALLRPGTPDVHTELRFPLADIADRIARGETTIPLAQLYQQVPQIFEREILELDPAEIRFPWQKVLKLINETDPGAAEALAPRLTVRHAKRNIVTGRGAGGLNVPESPFGKAGSKLAQRPVTWFTRPTAAPASRVEPAPAGAEKDSEPLAPEAKDGGESTMDIQESTALIEALREDFERELAQVRAEYEERIDALKAELAALRESRGETLPAE